MQSKNPIFNDISRLITNALGVAQNVSTEFETILKSRLDRWLAERDLVTREEFDAVALSAQKAIKEIKELRKELDIIKNHKDYLNSSESDGK